MDINGSKEMISSKPSRRRPSTRNSNSHQNFAFRLDPLEARQLLSGAVIHVSHPQIDTLPPDVFSAINPAPPDSSLSLNGTRMPIGVGAAAAPSTNFGPISVGDRAIDDFTLTNTSDHEISLTYFSFW